MCHMDDTTDRFGALLEANREYAQTHLPCAEAQPSRRLAVVTCMDARIDVFAALGLALGEVHVIRNAGARVTEDVLRSLALSTHLLGVDAVVVMQHTQCGLSGVEDDELRARTGADLQFHPIEDHAAALGRDVEVLAQTPFLDRVVQIAGFLYDVDSGEVRELVRWRRDS